MISKNISKLDIYCKTGFLNGIHWEKYTKFGIVIHNKDLRREIRN